MLSDLHFQQMRTFHRLMWQWQPLPATPASGTVALAPIQTHTQYQITADINAHLPRADVAVAGSRRPWLQSTTHAQHQTTAVPHLPEADVAVAAAASKPSQRHSGPWPQFKPMHNTNQQLVRTFQRLMWQWQAADALGPSQPPMHNTRQQLVRTFHRLMLQWQPLRTNAASGTDAPGPNSNPHTTPTNSCCAPSTGFCGSGSRCPQSQPAAQMPLAPTQTHTQHQTTACAHLPQADVAVAAAARKLSQRLGQERHLQPRLPRNA
jgi:hypothetical protein